MSDDSYKDFFGKLLVEKDLVSVVGFINSRKIFSAIKDYIKFGLVTLGQASVPEFRFLLTEVSQVSDTRRCFTLSQEEFSLLNPNTGTCPTFRTKADAALTKKIYFRVPVFINERGETNPWKAAFGSMFHMSSDSHLFQASATAELVPLYEAKMFHQWDHRFGTYEDATKENIAEGNLPQFTPAMHADPHHLSQPRSWVPRSEVEERIPWYWKHKWLIAFRDVTGNASERTAIFSILPRVGLGNSGSLLFVQGVTTRLAITLVANCNSLALDFVARQKLAGSHMNFFVAKQLPIFGLVLTRKLIFSSYHRAVLNWCIPRRIWTRFRWTLTLRERPTFGMKLLERSSVPSWTRTLSISTG